MPDKTHNILIIDDSETDAMIIQQALSSVMVGNEFSTLNNAADAIDLLNQKGKFETSAQPNLILLDLNMPDFNGFEFLRVIKKDPRFIHIPIIVISGTEEKSDILESYKLGANCFITKPTNPTKFTQTIAIINEFWLGIASLPEKDTD